MVGNEHRQASNPKPVHVLILTDARVHFPPIHKSSVLGAVHEWFYELGLRRTWHAALSMKPHAVVFLGDMLASGRKVKHSIECVFLSVNMWIGFEAAS